MAASIALNGLDSLCQVIVKEAYLFLVVEDQVKTLGDQLKLMGSFLRDAERAEGQEHIAMEELVIQIRDLTYEAEDIIEKYLVDGWMCKYTQQGKFIRRVETGLETRLHFPLLVEPTTK
ncbi:putative disease resistance protein At1g59780 [Telopea speciosissima]|uniref:putative disease resistance protein At1g59780 n=1 Tax=Telopea speciosissima TaxID=54955 RepID=UPI001CC6A4BC|nr:putative disease resistance protein At1g59780 [Telopea speciosissima]